MRLNILLPILAISLLFGIACGTSGPMASDDETALIGVVLDQDSYDRIAGATIQLVNDNVTATTNDEGTFSVVGASVGSHDVVIEAEGYSAKETTIEVERGGTRVQLFVNR